MRFWEASGRRKGGDHLRHESRGERLRAADPQLSRGRIGKKADLLYALLQLVEHGNPALQQGAPVHRGVDTLRMALEQADAERMFERSDRLRDRGL